MNLQSDHPQAMLTEIHIEALLVDEELADQVWNAGLISDELAEMAWWTTANGTAKHLNR